MRVLVNAATEECDPRLLAYCINVCPSRDKKASKTRLLQMRDVLGFIGSTGNYRHTSVNLLCRTKRKM